MEKYSMNERINDKLVFNSLTEELEKDIKEFLKEIKRWWI